MGGGGVFREKVLVQGVPEDRNHDLVLAQPTTTELHLQPLPDSALQHTAMLTIAHWSKDSSSGLGNKQKQVLLRLCGA